MAKADFKKTKIELFQKQVGFSESCWYWLGKLDKHGYGMYSDVPAHRLSWRLLRGEIPAGLQIDHLCRNPQCINPDHLEPVTPKENIRRGLLAKPRDNKRSHCIRGHEFTPENSLSRSYDNTRICRECNRIRSAESAKRKKERNIK